MSRPPMPAVAPPYRRPAPAASIFIVVSIAVNPHMIAQHISTEFNRTALIGWALDPVLDRPASMYRPPGASDPGRDARL
jgi:hypothetical protein